MLRLRQDKDLIQGQHAELTKQLTDAAVQQSRLETQLTQLNDVIGRLELKSDGKFQARI